MRLHENYVGESSANDELTHDLRGEPEGASISDCHSFRRLAGNWRCSNFKVLQHYRHLADMLIVPGNVRVWGTTDMDETSGDVCFCN